MSPLGFPFFVQEFEVIYIYGQTEFKAQVAWMEEVRLSRTHLWPTGWHPSNKPFYRAWRGGMSFWL